MAKYVVHNIGKDTIHLVINAPPGVKRGGYSLSIESNSMLDILPYAGSVEDCKRNAFLKKLEQLNLVRIYV